MDFGFMLALVNDYKQPNKATNRNIRSYDGFCAYLAIVDGASCWVWYSSQNRRYPCHAHGNNLYGQWRKYIHIS
jgi:hypothetical protein